MPEGGSDLAGVIGGFRITSSAPPEVRRRHVEHALALGLPELEQQPDRPERLSIYATGMSFWDAPHPALRPSLAVNGALRLLGQQGHAPDYWAACDSQELVADFLTDAPEETTYLIASVCHPAVFEALRDRRVLLWHLSDEDETQGYADLISGRPTITRGSSITLSAFGLGNALGFGAEQVWGWDGCMRGVRHHATDQVENREIVLAEVDGVQIPTTRVWIYELMVADGLLRHEPRDLIVHGDGLFARALARAGLTRQPEHA